MMMVIMYVGLIMVPSVYWHMGLSVSVSLLIASIWFDREQGLARFLARAPLVWLGTLTYAIYLLQTLAINLAQALLQKLHVPANFLAIVLAAYAVSVLVAWLAHVAIEQPAIDIARRLAAKRNIGQGSFNLSSPGF
ncbi:acyltransferase [Bradyrhizobium sp. 138]|uniref:acyltransferase family protein n=1 Tax=Bradyrhizobium sp. 138 TaxID=2782615 RepID=UPI001FFB2F76|nr:hypothetical protein [Bradyrhizobium sp. 138]MCK1735278.1 acyltransferase [Bradyrhizobium sp. 138]